MLTAATAAADSQGSRTPRQVGHLTAGGVDVTMTLTAWNGTAGTLQARFVPQGPGFHLYSADLPSGGVDGLGVATAFSVSGGLQATTQLAVEQPVSQLAVAGLGVQLPVYPDGPITTTIGIRRTGSDNATVDVSYAACSATLCLIPIINKHVRLAAI